MRRIVVLKIEMPAFGTSEPIYPAVLCDNTYTVLVDCGFIGSLDKIENALIENGIEPSGVTHIIITHHDHDHMGATATFKSKYPNVIIMSSDAEAPYVSGEKKSLRLTQAELLQPTLPPDMQAFGEIFCEMLRKVEAVKVDKTVRSGEVLPFCGGVEVINTTGHTPGHISLYVGELDTIITGDAMVVENGVPALANPQFAWDLEKATESFNKLLSYKPKTIICYHGGRLDY